jgi:hypothetical protein
MIPPENKYPPPNGAEGMKLLFSVPLPYAGITPTGSKAHSQRIKGIPFFSAPSGDDFVLQSLLYHLFPIMQ